MHLHLSCRDNTAMKDTRIMETSCMTVAWSGETHMHNRSYQLWVQASSIAIQMSWYRTQHFQRKPIRLFLTTNTDTHTNKSPYNSLPLQIALRYSNGRPTREPWLVNVPERSWDPGHRTPSQAEPTLMYKQVKTFFTQMPIQYTSMKKRKSPYEYVCFQNFIWRNWAIT